MTTLVKDGEEFLTSRVDPVEAVAIANEYRDAIASNPKLAGLRVLTRQITVGRVRHTAVYVVRESQ